MKHIGIGAFFCAALYLLTLPSPAVAATLIAKVSLSTQTMLVIENGKEKYRWKVSTARDGKVTPTGSWTAKQFKRFHWSTRYGYAPMPLFDLL